MSIDLLVIGGGFAGLTAANRSAELGLKVLVLEAGSDALYRCNSRFSTGSVHVAFHTPTTDPAELYAAIIENSEGTARKDLAEAITSRAALTIDWMRAQGASFADHPRRPDGMPMLAPLREMRAGLDWESSGADLFLQRLGALLLERGGELRRGVRAQRLIRENGAVTGVEVETANGAETIAANAVVIADGGFQGNPDLVKAHIGCRSSDIQRRNAGTGVGDGLRMATEIGAASVGLGVFYGHVLSRDAMSNEKLWPYPQVDLICATSLLVDGKGQRFADEGQGGIYLANAIAKLDNPLSATAIFDAKVWEEARTTDNVPPNPALTDAGGTVIEAATLNGLAEAAGLDTVGLSATIASYNRHLADGAAAALTPPRTEGKYTAQPVAEAPFYAIPVCAGITVTSGGLSVNGKGKVLDSDDNPVPGLYAAGSTVGGLEGGTRAAYVGGLIKSFGIGLIAAETIAAEQSVK
jgi:fumarate reductase flavoprotein subunit